MAILQLGVIHGVYGKKFTSYIVLIPMWICLFIAIVITIMKTLNCLKRYRKLSRVAPIDAEVQLAVKLASNFVLSGKGKLIYWFIYLTTSIIATIILVVYCRTDYTDDISVLSALLAICIIAFFMLSLMIFILRDSLM